MKAVIKYLAAAGLLALTGCAGMFLRNNQVLTNNINPMPNAVSRPLPDRNQTEQHAQAPFRDASIHEGGLNNPSVQNTPYTAGNQGFGQIAPTRPPGLEGVVLLRTSSLPSSNMLHANLNDYDWSRYQLIPFYGDSKGCTTRLTLPIPIRGSGNRRYIVPINFAFTEESFYQAVRHQMEANHIVALFDTRLDQERIFILFLFAQTCFRFSAWGIQERPGAP